MRKIKAGKLIYILYVLVILGALIVIMFTNKMTNIDNLKRELGEQAVKDLYSFMDAYALDMNMSDLKNITTDAVFSQLTIDNEERTLNTYLKFKNTVTSVDIVRSTDSYVIYHIKNENIDYNRVFIFLFSVNKKGKIDYVREMEGIDFIKNDN